MQTIEQVNPLGASRYRVIKQTKFNLVSSLVARSDSLLVFSHDRVQNNKFSEFKRSLTTHGSRMVFAKTTYIKLAISKLHPQTAPLVKGQCILVIVSDPKLEILREINLFASSSGLSLLVCILHGAQCAVPNLDSFTKYKSHADVVRKLLTKLRLPLRNVVKVMRNPTGRLLALLAGRNKMATAVAQQV